MITHMDKTQFESTLLEEVDEAPYICPFCGFRKDVEESYDLAQRMFFPVRWADTVCDKCGEYCEREVKA